MKNTIRMFIVASIVLFSACASVPNNPFLGEWTVTVDSPVGLLPGTFNFAADGSSAMDIEGQPQITPLPHVMFEPDSVTFSAEVDAGGSPLSVHFFGSIEDGALVGQFESDFGSMPVLGSRQ